MNAIVHLAAALEAAARSSGWRGDAADWLVDFCEARAREFSTADGRALLERYCRQIRGPAGATLREAVAGGEVSAAHLSGLETLLQSASLREPGGAGLGKS